MQAGFSEYNGNSEDIYELEEGHNQNERIYRLYIDIKLGLIENRKVASQNAQMN